jgi:sortase B
MQKKPNDYRQIIFLTVIFLIGLAMIFIPLVQQHQEIDADNNIYAMLAEEIKNQHVSQAVSTPQILPEEKAETEESPEDLPEETSEESFEMPPDEGPESLMVEELPLEEPEENPASEEPIESELPAMIVEEVIPSEKPETLPLQTNEPVKPITSAKPQNTKKPETKPTKAPTPENNDYVAWINIPGTVIDYPVVRSSRTEYYLHHMINGQESKLGCLFSLPTSDYQTPSKNIAIYGHHLSNSTAMFSTLMNYKREDYWRSHQTIQLDTIYGKRTYRIFAVINHTVSDWDASTASFRDDEAFLKFVNRAKRKAFYDTGIEVSESDHILTLITCDRSFGGVQGRLLVMGVEQ